MPDTTQKSHFLNFFKNIHHNLVKNISNNIDADATKNSNQGSSAMIEQKAQVEGVVCHVGKVEDSKEKKVNEKLEDIRKQAQSNLACKKTAEIEKHVTFPVYMVHNKTWHRLTINHNQ